MSGDRLTRIDRVVGRAIEAGAFPGAAVVIGRRGVIVWERGYGTLDWREPTRVDAERTMYDVASLTKVVATAAAAMVLVDRGRLRLEDPVARYVPAFGRGEKAGVTIRDLLTHRSGLPAGRNLRGSRLGPAGARQKVLGTPLEAPPGMRGEYSDLGPDVLGFAIERMTGEPLNRFVGRAVYAPLDMRSTMFRPPPVLRTRIAPTSPGGARGLVHDGNAQALGGVAGHAGLFSTAGDLAVFAQMMLSHGAWGRARIAGDTTVALFTHRAVGWRAIGWDTCAGGGSCGHYLTAAAFGHTGFTGTSMWIDPELDLFVIVLTNWVHGRPDGSVAPSAILSDVRGDIADLAVLSIADGDSIRPMPERLRTDLQIGWWP
jgi:CubicO group peptidase (beta-lactamase class C family)